MKLILDSTDNSFKMTGGVLGNLGINTMDFGHYGPKG